VPNPTNEKFLEALQNLREISLEIFAAQKATRSLHKINLFSDIRGRQQNVIKLVIYFTCDQDFRGEAIDSINCRFRWLC